jgi:hypothetical protein
MPSVVIALDQEGVDRRRSLFKHLEKDVLVIQISGVRIPASKARIQLVDLKDQGIKGTDRALASLAVLAKLKKVIRPEMLEAALRIRFRGKVLKSSLELIDRVKIGQWI